MSIKETLKRISPWHRAGTGGGSDDTGGEPEANGPVKYPDAVYDTKALEGERTKTTAGSDLTVWKATREGIAKLKIPEGAEIVTTDQHYGKSRASKAKVLALYEVEEQMARPFGDSEWIKKQLLDGRYTLTESGIEPHHSIYNRHFYYRPGDTVTPDGQFDTLQLACASGIHFFTKQEHAVIWYAFQAPVVFPTE